MMTAISFSEFEAGVRRAEEYVDRGRWRQAFDLYGELLTRRIRDLRFETAALTSTELLVLERIADIAGPLGEGQAADALYAVACDRYLGTEPQHYVHAAVKRITIALADDRFGDAMQLARALEPVLGRLEDIDCTAEGLTSWERARPWNPAEASWIEAQIYLALGRLLAGMGQYTDAGALYRRGLEYASDDRAPLALQARTPLLLAVATAALHCGHVQEVRRMLAEVTCAPDRPGDLVRRHELDAGAAILAGDFTRAEQALGEAAGICRENGFTHGLAASLLSRAKLLIVINRLPEAAQVLAEAKELSEALGAPAIGRRASHLAAFARVRQQTLFGDASFALPAAGLQVPAAEVVRPLSTENARDVDSWRPADFFAYYEERELGLMAAADADGRAAERDRLLAMLVADFEGTDSPLLHARLDLLRGATAVQAGDWSAARASCRRASDAFNVLELPADEYVARRFEAICAEHLSEPEPAVRQLRARAQQLLAVITAGMPAENREAYLVNKWSQQESELGETVGRLIEERQRIEDRTFVWRWFARLGWSSKVGALHRALEQGASASVADISGWRARIEGLAAIVAHPRDAQTLAFASLPNLLICVVVGWCYCDLSVRRVARGRIRTLVRRFHELIAIGDRVADAAADSASKELAGELQLDALLHRVPARVTRLTIYPDDQLHAVPFAAMPLAAGGLVIDSWAITIGVRRLPPLAAVDDASAAITIAATHGGDAWPRLPEAAVQTRWLADWWALRGVRANDLADADCDAARFLGALGASRILHFSGHGTFNANVPDETGVVVRGTGTEHAIVSIAKMASADCRRLQLATFFSCWGADSFMFPNHWAVSMPSTLCRAGARAVVAPLWELEDRLSTELLKGMYDRLPTQRVDEAVRAAQLEARTMPDGRRRSPFFWAGLQVYGDGRRLSFLSNRVR